jgi:ribose 5-phosphate isomerase B
MRVGIATDHGGFGLKEELVAHLRAAGHEVVDFGAHNLNPGDDFPISSSRSLRPWRRGRWRAGWRSAAAASERRSVQTRYRGIRAGLVHDHFSARQGVEDDHINIICMGGRTIGPLVPGTSSRRFWGPSSVKPSVTCAVWAKWRRSSRN